MINQGQPFEQMAELAVWGCPWHGLVSTIVGSETSPTGNLALANGSTMPYRRPNYGLLGTNPSPSSDTYGNTYLFKAPGIADVGRTVEQLAADFDAGMEWREAATISGGRMQLYGKPLDGWIYIDGAGTRWLVQCPQIINTPNGYTTWNFTFQKFGALGVASETHVQSISAPIASLVSAVSAIRQDGARAIVTVGVGAGFTTPYAYVELTLSNPSVPTVSAAIVAYASQDSTIFDTTIPLTEHLDGGGDNLYYSSNGATTFNTSVLVGLWYNDIGALVEVVARLSGSAEELNPELPESDPGGGYTVVCTASASGAYTLEVGGVVKVTVAVSASLSATTVYGAGGSAFVGEWIVGAVTDAWTFPDLPPRNSYPRHYETHVGDLIGVMKVMHRISSASFSGNSADAIADYQSRQVIGLKIVYPAQSGGFGTAAQFSPVATPTGTSGTLVTATRATVYYGSHDPYTGSVSAFNSRPVCWV